MKLIQEGPRKTKIVLVGESPGRNEEAEGRPFIGGSGQVLSRMLSASGIHRDECFVTNICHVKPPGDRFDWFFKKENQSHLIQGILQLKSDLEEIKPNIVVALGAQPLRILSGKIGIDKWRGSIIPSTLVPGLKVIGTYHPAYILRVWDYKVIAEFDLRRVKEESNSPEIDLPKYDFYLDESHERYTAHKEPERLGKFDRSVIIAEMMNAEYLSIDIECWESPTGWQLACVGFSDIPGRALVIPIRDLTDINSVRELCGCPAKKVFQNGTFDVTVLRDSGIEVNNFAWDIMLGHHALYAECAGGSDEMSSMTGKKKQAAIRKGLDFQTSMYTRQPYYKDASKIWKQTGDLELFWRYNALDTAVTMQIRDIQSVELVTFGTLKVLAHEMSLVQPLMALTCRGILVDMKVREALRKKYQEELVNLQAFLDAGAGRHINVKSPADIPWLLFDKLGLKPLRHSTKTGNPSADKDVINELAGKYDSPLLHVVLRIREKRDMIERYIDAAVSTDGRMRCSFDITGTRSGRLSSRASLDGSGTNLQTIPGEMRRMFIADPGKVFVYRDYSQAEARIVAYLARSNGLIDLFNDPTRDIHKENASRIFNKTVDKVTATERYLAKRVIHASNYGMGAKRLVELVAEDADNTGVRINKREAELLIERYFGIYPEIREVFWKDVERSLKRTLTLNTPFSRKRTFYGRWDDKLLREAYSYVPQSTVGDLCCKALVNMYHQIQEGMPETETEILLNVHDSLLVQCKIDAIDKVASAMAHAMNISISIHGESFTIPTDCKVGRNWGDASDDNPDGLREID